jgi:hypothetical protein
VSDGMAFVPRSSNQFHCYRFRLRFVKRKQEADPPNTSWHRQNNFQNLFPAVRLHRGLLPSLEGNRDFYDFALTPAIRLIASYQHIWNPLATDVSKNKNGADVFPVRLTVAF